MADPATIALGAGMGLDFLKSLFGDALSGKEKTSYGDFMRNVNTAGQAQEQIGSFWQQQQQLLAPILGWQAQGAVAAGARARTTLEARLGSLGLSGSGMGEMARAFGSTFASMNVANARLQSFTDALARASEMGLQTQLANLQAFTGIRQGELGRK